MRSLIAALVLLIPTFAVAQRAPFAIPDPDPEVERKSFIVADGFEVNLFAADPRIAKPIQMNFDPAGRLWIVSSEVYPQIKPGQVANDKVIVLEDRDGDGTSDSTEVFAEGLLIPTGIEPGDGGAYVANSTELLHFRDTDGDGKADKRRVMLSGFGTEDTHHILHTLRWGYEGMLYFNQSIYIHSHVETPHGVRRLGGGGIWEFRPETMELAVFMRGLVNPWGHHFDRWGQSFATDGAGGEGINYVLPGAYYVTAPDAVRILKGLNPGSPKHCGAEVVGGRHLPDDWSGNVVTNDFRGNRVCRFVIQDDGAGYASREQAELIKTKHVAFRPIDVKMGPDGAIYIADWYNPIIQHGEVDFRDPRRDHTRGRIWRVTAKGRPLVARPKLVGASTDELLEALKAPEDWTRHQAKRVIKERGAEVAPALAAWVKGLDPADPRVEHHRLEGLWTYQSLDLVEPDLLAKLLRAPDPRVRAAATRVVSHWHPRLSDPLALLEVQVADDHPRVRLEAVRALAHIPRSQSVELAMRALDRPVDRFLDYALWLTARELQPHWLAEAEAGGLDFGGNSRHMVFALEAVGSKAVLKPLLASLRSGQLTPAQEANALALIATRGDPNELTTLFDWAVSESPLASERRVGYLKAITQATRQRKVRPSGNLGQLGRLLDGPDESLREAAARAAGLWGVQPLWAKLVEIARAEGTREPLRRAAIDGLEFYGGPGGRQALQDLAGAKGPDRARDLAIAALIGLDAQANAPMALARLEEGPSTEGVETIMTRFLQRRDGPGVLVTALSGRKLPADVAKVGIRVSRASGLEVPALIDVLQGAGGLSAGPSVLTPEAMNGLVADVAARGDAGRGEAIFRRKDLDCFKCHAIAGAGGQVGPGLESVGASAPVDYLVDSLLQPGKAIKENFHALVVATIDGRIATGIKVRQSDTELVLRDADDRELVLPVDAIEEQKPGGSLMPAGLTETLTQDELVDLVRFLSELGKIGPYSVGQVRAVRRWQVLQPSPQSPGGQGGIGLDAVASSDPRLNWSPAYSQVSGDLPLDAIPSVVLPDRATARGFARGQIDVSTAGKVKLLLPSITGLELWIDGARHEPTTELAIDLAVGTHTVTFAVDPERRREPLRLVLEEETGSSARAQVVVGK